MCIYNFTNRNVKKEPKSQPCYYLEWKFSWLNRVPPEPKSQPCISCVLVFYFITMRTVRVCEVVKLIEVDTFLPS